MLALNPKFVPKPPPTAVSDALDAFDDFARRLRLRGFATSNKPAQSTLCSYFGKAEMEKGQLTYVPEFHIANPNAEGPPLINLIENALGKVRDQLELEVLSRQSIRICPNINQRELEQLLKLLCRNNLLALPADKNLGLCLVTTEWYHQAGLKLLRNASYIEDEPDFYSIRDTLKAIIEKSKKLLTSQQLKWLLLPCEEGRFKVPTLKVIPKIHKLPISGRPIVPTFDTMLANASAWVDYQIKPHLAKFPWILPDSKTFCRQILELELPMGEEIWLVSGDVVAMYPNIPVEDGIREIAKILRVSDMSFNSLHHASQLNVRSIKELTVLLLRMVLKYNYVSFADKTYRQVIGTAMGTACAPTYANLFLANAEKVALTEMKDIILYYSRFIDDTFAIIRGTLEDVLRFQKRFGNLHPNMRMEWAQSRHRLPFLDISVALEVAPGTPAWAGQLELVTRVYQKALNAYLYIPWNSCHSANSKRAWVKGELIRYIRICSREEDFSCIQKEFAIRLHARGYPGRWLHSVFDEVSYSEERPTALTSSKDNPEEDPIHVLKLTHNPIWDDVDLGPIWHELRKVWKESVSSISDLRFLASFKKPPALGDQLNKSNWDTMKAFHDELALNV